LSFGARRTNQGLDDLLNLSETLRLLRIQQPAAHRAAGFNAEKIGEPLRFRTVDNNVLALHRVEHLLLGEYILRHLRIRQIDECVELGLILELIVDAMSGHDAGSSNIESNGRPVIELWL